MTVFFTLWRRELASYFLSPIAYVVTIFFLLITGFNFYLLVDLMTNEYVSITEVMGQLFGSVLFFWPAFLLVIPVLTMHTFAEEVRFGTMETLMTAPVSDVAIVLSKFFGVLSFFVIIWTPTAAYAVILEAFSMEAAPLDEGPLLSGYLGTLLLGMWFLSIGIFCSAISRRQVIAAVTCFSLCGFLFYLGFLQYYTPNVWLRELSTYLSVVLHQLEFARGVIDTRPVILYLSGTAFMLFLTIRCLEARHW